MIRKCPRARLRPACQAGRRRRPSPVARMVNSEQQHLKVVHSRAQTRTKVPPSAADGLSRDTGKVGFFFCSLELSARRVEAVGSSASTSRPRLGAQGGGNRPSR